MEPQGSGGQIISSGGGANQGNTSLLSDLQQIQLCQSLSDLQNLKMKDFISQNIQQQQSQP